MEPYIIKFRHHGDALQTAEMSLCLHAPHRRLAAELFWEVTGGMERNNELISITGSDRIEAFWVRQQWKFVTIPA